MKKVSFKKIFSPKLLSTGLILLSIQSVCILNNSFAKTTRRYTTQAQLTTPEPTDPLGHNNRGYELGQRGLWPQAIKEHELALEGDIYNKQFRTNLSAACLHYGEVLLAKRDYYGAMTQFRESLYVDPTNLPADQDLDSCIKHLGKDPHSLKTRDSMADEAEISGNYQTAVVEYRKCVKMADNGPYRYKLGKVLIKQNKIEEGYLELRTALTKDWEMNNKEEVKMLSQCHALMGNILKDHAKLAQESGQQDVAVKRLNNAAIEFKRACAVNPSNTDAVRGLLDTARQAVAVQPSFNNHLMLGGAYLLSGDFEHSRLEYSECWKLQPNNPDLAKARRVYYLNVVKSPLATPQILSGTLEKVQASLISNQQDAELYYIFGRGKEALGDKATALKAYQIAYKINPYANSDLEPAIKRLGAGDTTVVKNDQAENSSIKNEASDTKAVSTDKNAQSLKEMQQLSSAESKIHSNDLSGAQSDLNSILDKNPVNGRAWYLMGLCNEKMGKLDEAASCYRSASNFKEPNAKESLEQVDILRVKPLIDKADSAKNSQNWVEVSSSMHEAIIMAPNIAILHRKLAEALQNLGDPKAAQIENQKADKLEKK